jgi:hypothetical protein
MIILLWESCPCHPALDAGTSLLVTGSAVLIIPFMKIKNSPSPTNILTKRYVFTILCKNQVIKVSVPWVGEGDFHEKAIH